MKDVLVDGEVVPVDPRRMVGAGGEAIVLAHGRGKRRCALKLFRDPTEEKREKIERLIARAPWPTPVVAPLAVATEPRTGKVVGYTMPLVEGGAEPIAMLSRPAHRDAKRIGKRSLAGILTRLGEALGAIHRAGVVVGDLNDHNELVDDEGDVWFIDADSFQLDGLPCTVASELFLDPLLYGPDPAAPCLSPRPRTFTVGSDWYAFATIAFRSLTGVHPFGGAHAALPTVPARSRAGVTVFDANVTIPAPAREGIATLTRSLRDQFERVFAARDRGAFDLRALRSYAAEIVRCGCGLELPASRLPCPRCAPRERLVVASQTSRVTHRELSPPPPAAPDGRARDATYTLVRGWLFAESAAGARPIATVLEGQARTRTSPRVEGCAISEQRFGERVYRFARRGAVTDLDVPTLEVGERPIEEALVVGDDAIAVLRVTQRAGERRVRSSWFALDPSAACAVASVVSLDVAAATRLAGESIAGGVLVRAAHLVATDRGLVREDLLGRTPAVDFAAPPHVVRDGAELSLSSEGLIVRVGDRAFALEVSP